MVSPKVSLFFREILLPDDYQIWDLEYFWMVWTNQLDVVPLIANFVWPPFSLLDVFFFYTPSCHHHKYDDGVFMMIHSWESRRPFWGPYWPWWWWLVESQWLTCIHIRVCGTQYTGCYSGSWVSVGCPQAGLNWTTRPFLPPRASKHTEMDKPYRMRTKPYTVSRQRPNSRQTI